MRKVLAAAAVACAALSGPGAGHADGLAPGVGGGVGVGVGGGAGGLHAAFDPAGFDAIERRLLESALAAAGDLAATPDTVWDAASDAALAAHVARRFDDRPRSLHVGALAIGFLAQLEAEGWAVHVADGGIVLALPEAIMDRPEPEEGGTRRWSRDGALTVLTHRFSTEGTATWHAAAEATNADAAALGLRRDPGLLVTRGALADGRVFHTRSDRTADGWTTVYLASEPATLGHLELIAASIAPAGEPGSHRPWELPAGGRLAGLLEATVDFLQAVAGDLPGAAGAAAGAVPAGLPAAAGATMTGTATAALDVTGTGFFVAERVLVTASHVVDGCGRVVLTDGTELRRLGLDAALDVAAFASPRPAPAWFTLSNAPRARLGQRVHAAGFPYYSIVGTALHLTGGNVSALAGVNDDARFFSFTAPVQPGNSGGPLIGADGRVMGLVVSRLSEHYIVGETGSLPQNMNYALASPELAAFLERIGLERTGAGGRGGGFDAFDMDAGTPAGFEAAVVPVICL